MSLAPELLQRVDRWQQRGRIRSVAVAVVLRYTEDRGREYGAMLSYYGFVSLFPLLLVFVTVLGFVLQDQPELRDDILDSVYGRIPVFGEQMRESATGLHANGWLLAAGLVVALWSGLLVVRRAQAALDLQWGVPRTARPGFLRAQLRAAGVLGVVGVGLVLASTATALAAFLPALPWSGRALGALIAIGVNIVVLTVSLRVLVSDGPGWRAFVPGGAAGGIALWALQLVGGTYVSRVIVGAVDTYGTFATMFGLLVWIALLAHVVLMASEINVVLAKHLWPRSLAGAERTEADHRAAEENVRREVLWIGGGATGASSRGVEG